MMQEDMRMLPVNRKRTRNEPFAKSRSKDALVKQSEMMAIPKSGIPQFRVIALTRRENAPVGTAQTRFLSGIDIGGLFNDDR